MSDPTNDDLLAQQRARESSARTYPRHLPVAIERAQGLTIEDVEGNTYLDCLAGAGSLPLGHNHPAVVDAMRDVLDAGRPLHTLDMTTPVKEAFLDELYAVLPDEFVESARVQFCSPAGTDAVEAAIKLVKTATGNRSIVGFQGAYHGMTNGALGLMGNTEPKEPVPGLMSDVHHLPYPYEYRPPFDVDDVSDRTAEYVERTLSDPNGGIVDPAGVIVEPVQGEGGAIPAPTEWLREVRRITRERDIPLIVDEIQSGLGRTGELWAFEHAGIVPDVVTVAKAVGGGLPLAVVCYREELDEWEPGAHAGTFRGNQLGMAAGRATMERIREDDLAGHAARMGERLHGALAATEERFDAVGDVRGRGLMLGVEFVDPAGEPLMGAPPPDDDLATAVQSACLDRGLVVERGGRGDATVRFLPPLVVSKRQVDRIGEIFAAAVAEAVGARTDAPEVAA